MPKRIQMSRQRPWRAMWPDAVVVARPGKWGNPFKVSRGGGGWQVTCKHYPALVHRHDNRANAIADAIGQYRSAVELGHSYVPSLDEIRSELAGRDLACWCPPGPCHGDALIEFANREADHG